MTQTNITEWSNETVLKGRKGRLHSNSPSCAEMPESILDVSQSDTQSFPSSWLNYDFYKIKKTVYVHKYRWGFPDRIQGLLPSMLQLSRMRGIPSSSLTWGKQDDKELTSWNWSCCTTFISDSIIKIHLKYIIYFTWAQTLLREINIQYYLNLKDVYSCSICSSSALKFLQKQVN